MFNNRGGSHRRLQGDLTWASIIKFSFGARNADYRSGEMETLIREQTFPKKEISAYGLGSTKKKVMLGTAKCVHRGGNLFHL